MIQSIQQKNDTRMNGEWNDMNNSTFFLKKNLKFEEALSTLY